MNMITRTRTRLGRKPARWLGMAMAAGLLLAAQVGHGQCTNTPNGQWPGANFTPNCTGAPQTIVANAWTGEYSNVNLVAGTNYTFSSNIGSHYITIMNSAGVALAWGPTPLNYVAASTAVHRFATHLNAACGVGSFDDHSRIVSCTGAPPEVCTYNVPASGTNTITACSGSVCDPGGVVNYPDNANGLLVINPATPGDNVRLTWNSFNTEPGWDFVTVFDGVGTGAPVIFGPASGTTLPPVLTASNGPLTVRFTSDGSVTRPGFNATISCVSPPPPAACLTAGFGQYPSGAQTPVCDGNANAISPTNAWAGEYTTVALTAGVEYSFTSSIATDWITIGNAAGTVGLEFGVGPVTFTPGATANYRFYTHANAACGENTTNRTRFVQCIVPPGCAAAPTAPADGAVLCFDGELSWPSVALATGYDVYLDAGAGPATTLVSSNQPGTTYNTGALNGAFSWRVEPRNVAGAATGCTDWTFEALPSPAASASNDGPACVGQTVQLTGVTGAAIYEWSGPNGYTSGDLSPVLSNVSVADAGDYTFTADNGSCTFSATTTLVVNEVAPAPTATTNYAICVNGGIPPGQGLTAVGAPVPGSAFATYTAGAIPTNSFIDVNCNGPANLAVNIPPGAVVTGVNVSYVFEGIGFDGWMNEQRNRLVCLSTGNGESGPQAGGYYSCVDAGSGSSACGGNPGVVTYIRNGLSIANGVSATGVVNFQMQAFRTWNGTPGGCNSVQNRINNNTWTVTVNYELPASIIWFDAASGGSQVGSGSPFNPVAANVVDASIGGFYTLYAAVDDPNCPSARLPAILSVGDQNTTFEITTDLSGSQTTWEIVNADNGVLVCSGGPYFDGFTITIPTTCCMPEGCYTLSVFDSAGDGMVNGLTGGYELRNAADNRRIIDNKGNGTFGAVSQINNSYSFCMPIGDVEPIYTSCDKYWWRTGEFLVATPDAAVSAEWIDLAPNTAQSTTTGYEFWFYNPNGGYSFRRFRNHRTSDGFANVGAVRACHMKVNNWAVANHIPEFDLMNVRIRPVINGVSGDWGPACRFVRNQALSLCPPTKLMDIPGNQFLSCGQFRQFGVPGQRVHSRPVAQATQYEWRFRIPAENTEIIRSSTTYFLNLNWGAAVADPLEAGKTYEVDVRAFRNGAWCVDPLNPDSAWGDICLLTIQNPPAQGGNQNLALDGTSEFSLWPNPNSGDQFWINMDGIADDVLTVAVDIHDLTGKRVVAREIPTQGKHLNTVIDINGDLANGVYLVSIIAGDKRYTERLVIAN